MKMTWMLLLVPMASFAYKVETHMNMTTSAMQRSVLSGGNVLTDLGLEESLTGGSQKFPDHRGIPNYIKDLMRWGSTYEDDEWTKRSLRHFFDPISYRGIIAGGISQTSSPDWILEDTGDDDDQHYSYKDANEFLYKAITEPANTDRKQNFGLLFQSLGHVVHHIQDMAQPQHVRNDAHCDGWLWGPLCVIGGQYDPSHYEVYSNKIYGGGDLGIAGPTGYPIPAFTTAREYWTTLDDKGLADFTNYNFVSKDTNFNQNAQGVLITTKYTYPQPIRKVPHNIADADMLGTAGQTLCAQLKSATSNYAPGDCYIDFVETNVSGTVTGENPLNDRASSHSVFNKYLEDYELAVPSQDGAGTARAFFTLNPLNYDAAHNYLIPRAVAYSAGLINHFFRGKMQISLPDAGVYGLVDKSTLPGFNLETGFIGFNKIKLKVTNTTPSLPGQLVPEAMNNGTLESVIKFHRNTCTEADLSAEPPLKTITATQCRSVQEEIVVSSSQTISVGNALTTEPREFTFTFPTNLALPINAIDVYLQVVYKGQLGSEAQAVVVATKDISEPSFVTILNSSDYLATIKQVQNYKAYVINDLNHQQLTEILSDLGVASSERNTYCLGGPADNMSWTGGAVTASHVACIPKADPLIPSSDLHIKIFDKYTLNRSAPAPIKITLDGLPQQRHATLAFLTDKDGEVTLDNTGFVDPVEQAANSAFQSPTYPHVYCGFQYPDSTCRLKVNQTQFGPTDTLPPTAFGKARSTYGTGPVLNVFYNDQTGGFNTTNGLFRAVYLTENPIGQLSGAYKVINDMMSPVPATNPFPVTIDGWP